ncbi:MAG: hypothetical protein QOF44_4183, partial [Streptomyces sp.]|nr:hypothetical protein [Streptomyces sp.]MDX6314719.1 hypothetical protein [Streptomyces sp.]
EIAQLLGGAITASSSLGEGSVFSLHLPVAWFEPTEGAPPQDTEAATEPPAPQGPPVQRRLLVIEERRQGLLSLLAESAVADLAEGRSSADPRGAVQVRTATGAEEIAAGLSGEACHCVILDLDMADGAALRILDALDGDPAIREVPVLAHHSRRLAPDHERLLRNHAARGKPLELLPSLDELRERIALHLTAERPADVLPLVAVTDVREAAGGPTGERASALDGRTVLVVDDDARNVYALTGMLELQGVRVLRAENGREGMEILARHREIEMILMDVMMPEMDGYAATSAIRAVPGYADLPIIAVTAKAMDGDREKSLAAGASDYIAKPVDTDMLIACMQRWLSQ